MKKVLLVNPWIYDFSAFDLWLKPLGLLYIASFLEAKGYEVILLDCLDRFHPLLVTHKTKQRDKFYGTGKYLAENITKPEPIKDIPLIYKRFGIPYDIVTEYLKGLNNIKMVIITSVMTYWYPGVFDMIKTIRDVMPGVTIALGGIYATLLTKHAKEKSGADIVISGLDFSPILRQLGISTNRFDEEQFFNTYSPAYHLYHRTPYISMLTSLGCPFHCSYCVSRLLIKKFFPLCKDKILQDIDMYVKKFKVKDIAFYDDAMLYRKERHFLPLFTEIIKRRYPVRFHSPNGLNARFITKEVANLLKMANFRTIRIGFESSNAQFQSKTGSKVTCEEIQTAVSNLLHAGIPNNDIGIYVMAGRRDEKPGTVIETLRFLSKLGVKVFISEYSPVPGSLEWDEYEDFKKLDPLWQNNSIAFLKNGWSREDMQKIKDLKELLNYAVRNHIPLSLLLNQ